MGLAHRIAACASCIFFVASCGWKEMKDINEPLKLAVDSDNPTTVSVDQLRRGQEQYILYCRPCHGVNGDGLGPAGIGLRPPPRNFALGEDLKFKFAGVESGDVPPDTELRRIILGGLDGTPMLQWDLADETLDDIVAYLKSFSPEFWSEDEPAEAFVIEGDPWKGKEDEAIALGKAVYHSKAQCVNCHPAYASQKEMYDMAASLGANAPTIRPGITYPVAKTSDYGTFLPKQVSADGDEDEDEEREKTKGWLLPPDFGRHAVKAGALQGVPGVPDESLEDGIYRTVAMGIPGTAMPAWKDSMEKDQVWALAYYVASITKLRTTDEGRATYRKLMKEVRAAPAYTPPPPPAEDGEEGAEGEAAAE